MSAPETADEWAAALHRAIRLVPTADPDLSFLASLLGQCLERPGLTPKQQKWASRILDRVAREFGELRQPPVNLATAEVRGRA